MTKPKNGSSNNKHSGHNAKKTNNRRSRARLAAVQALYQMDVAQTDLNAVIKEFKDLRLGAELEGDQLEKADVGFFMDLLTGIVKEQRRLDPLIDRHLASSWRLNRIDSTLRAILRAGAYELDERGDVPGPVVISEYVDVAHAFFEKDEPKVVNGVLQNLWNSLKVEEATTATFQEAAPQALYEPEEHPQDEASEAASEPGEEINTKEGREPV